ncbi:MAG: hypothetical protein KDI27_13545, partial [Gammaproteobacteria bacterium]|nr:hypothetical protein [Gammaproteobacteria bacterium]
FCRTSSSFSKQRGAVALPIQSVLIQRVATAAWPELVHRLFSGVPLAATLDQSAEHRHGWNNLVFSRTLAASRGKPGNQPWVGDRSGDCYRTGSSWSGTPVGVLRKLTGIL